MSTPAPAPAASSPSRSHRRRVAFALNTALGGLLLLPEPAAAQLRLPTRGDVRGTNTSFPGLAPEITNPNGDLRVELRARNTVIDWNGFNIPEDRTVAFRNGTPLNVDMAVLNRDLSGNVSQLLGKLVSDRNVAVWVYNPNGILVGSKAAFNTGSLVLTTLDVDADDFRAGGRDFRLTGAANSQSAITVANGAQIRVEGGTRGLIMVAPKIDADGSFEAVGQDVAFVTASDVTLRYDPLSPLSVTLNRGTAVSGRSQYVRGTVAGNDALFALASQANVTDALLQVGAGVTTATAGSRGIVLSAGAPANAVAGVSVGPVAANTGGTVDLQVDGVLASRDTGSAIVAGSNGTATFAGSLAARGDVVLDAGGLLDVRGNVTAEDDIRFAGRGIALGAPGTVRATFDAADELLVRSTDGDIVGNGALTLRSGSAALTSMALIADGTTAGNILLGGESNMVAGSDRRGTLAVRVRAPGNRVSLGDVTAGLLAGTVGDGRLSNRLELGSAVTLGNVNVRDALLIGAGSIVAGALASDRGIALTSTGTVTAASLIAGGGAATIDAGGTITATGLMRSAAGSDVVARSPGAVTLTNVESGGDILVGGGTAGGSATISGSVFAAGRYVVDAGTVTLGGIEGARQAANGAVELTAGSGGIRGLSNLRLIANEDGIGDAPLDLTIDAARAGGVGGTIDFAPATHLLGGPAQRSDIRVRLADGVGSVRFGRVDARDLFGAVGTGAFATGIAIDGDVRTGAVSLRGSIALAGASVETGALTSGTGGVQLAAASGTVRTGAIGAARGIAITGPGAVTTAAMTAGDGITVDAGGLLTVGDASAGQALALRGDAVTLSGASITGGGTIDILARGGGIVAPNALTLQSTSGRGADFIGLQAAGVDGIRFGQGSRILAGANRALNVRIFRGDPASPLALGDVSARSLAGLDRLDGDPLRAGVALTSTGSLSFGRLDLVEAFAAESLTGDLTVGGIAVTGAGQGIDLRAAQGSLSTPSSLVASGAITLASGTALRLDRVESRDRSVSIASGGSLNANALAGATGVTASGTTVAIGTVTGGAVRLSSTTGDMALNGVDGTGATLTSAGALNVGPVTARSGSVLLDAAGTLNAGAVRAVGGSARLQSSGGTVTAVAGVDAGDDVRVSGRSVTLGGAQRAGGNYTASTTAGAITGAAGLSILSDSDGANGGGIALSASGGDIMLPGAPLTGATVRLTTDGGGIAVGDVSAASLVVSGARDAGAAIRTGNLSLSDGLALRAAAEIVTGSIATGSGAVEIVAGGATTLGNVDGTGAVSLSGSTLRFGNVNAASVTAGAGSGTVTGGNVTAAADVGIEAASGAVTLGRVSSTAGDVSITSGGRLFASRVGAGGSATLTARGSASDVAIAEGVSADGPITVRSGRDILAPFIRSRLGDLTVAAPDGSVAGYTPGQTIDLGAGPGRAFSLTVGSAARLGDIVGGSIAVTATSITANRVDAGTQAVTLRASSGDLSVSGPVVGGTVTLDATGRTSLASVNASGALVLGGRQGLAFGEVSGSTITATSGGGLTGNGAQSTGRVAVEGSSVNLGRVAAGNGLAVAANGGNLALGTATSTGDLALTATGRIDAGAVNGRGTVTLTGGDAVAFGTLTGATVSATGGAITGDTASATGTLSLRGTTLDLDTADAGGSLLLEATGGSLSVTTASSAGDAALTATGRMDVGAVTGGGAVTLTGGEAVSFGTLSGAKTAVTGNDITGAAASAIDALTIRGTTLSLGSADAGTLSLEATGGNLFMTTATSTRDAALAATGRIDAGAVIGGGAVTLTGGDAVAFGTLSGANVTATGGVITGDTVSASDTLSLRGTALSLNSINAGALSLEATGGNLSVTTATSARDASLIATGRINAGAVTGGGAVTLTGGDAVSFGTLSGANVAATGGIITGDTASASDTLLLRGSALSLNSIDAGALLLEATGGNLSVTSATSAGDAALTATGRIDAGAVTGGGAVTLTGGDAVSFGTLSGANVAATGGVITGDTASASDTLLLRGTALSLNSADAGTLSLEATGGNLSVTSATSAGDAALTATGRIDAGAVTGGGAVTLTGGDAVAFRTLSGARVSATGGVVTGGTATATDTLSLRGTTLGLDSADAGALLSLEASVGDLSVNRVRGGQDVTLLSAGRATLGSVLGAGTVALDATGDLRFADVSGGTVAIEGANITGDTVAAAGALAVQGTGVAIARVDAGGNASVRAGAGDLRLDALTSGGDVALSSAGAATLGRIDANGAVSVGAGGDVRFAAIDAGRVDLAGRGIAGNALTADGDVRVRGADVTLASAETGGAVAIDATTGGLRVGSLKAGGDVVLGAASLAQIDGAVTAGGAYRVTAGSVLLGGTGVEQRAVGELRIRATGGDIRGGAGLTLVSDGDGVGADALVLDAAGGIDLAGGNLRAGSGGGARLGLRAGNGRAIRLGSVAAQSIGGVDNGAVLERLDHAGSFEAGDLTVSRLSIDAASGDLRTGRIVASGAVGLRGATGAVTTADVTAASLDARAGGDLALGQATIGGAAILEAANVTAAGLTAGSLSVRTVGALGAAGGGRLALRTTGGDLVVDAGSARLGDLDSAGAATLKGDSIDVAGRLASARQLLADARRALTIGDATAGGDMTLKSGGTLGGGALNAGAALAVEAAGDISVGSARSAGTMAFTGGGALRLGSGTTGSSLSVDAGGLATLGALTAGPSIRITAADAELAGPVRATDVGFATRSPATTAMRLGDGTAADGFRLSAAEVGQVGADTVRFDAGAGALEIGTLALAPELGRSVDLLSTGDIRVSGVVTSSSMARGIRLGGDGAGASAATLHVAATNDAGGRLLLDGADVELNANRIAVGLGRGFLDTLLPGDAGRAQAQALIGNANSALYNAQLGGGFFAQNATTTVAARSLSVRFGDYALFQNTGLPGQSLGVTVGGSVAAPVLPALRVATFGDPAAATFALFGSINGINGASASLLNTDVIDIDSALLPNARLNGCLVGSGAGCLTTIAIQPTLQVFDWDSQSVFGISQDVAVPFTPIIGGNNEELLTGLPALAPEQPAPQAPAVRATGENQESPL